MKKIGILLLSVLLCAAACFPAFADMGGPEMIGYTVTVKNSVDYYNWEYNEATQKSTFRKSGVLPAGTELQISNEYNVNGEMYAYFFDVDKVTDDSGYVRIADLQAPSRPAVSQSSGVRQSISVRLRVTDPNGIMLYAGPSGTYAVVGNIPVGTELTVNTLDQDGYETGAWMYVSHGGISGWTYCWLYDSMQCPMAELLPKGTTGTIWVVKDGAVLKDRDGNKLVSVPKGEKLTFDSFNRTAHVIVYYVTYNGKQGYFSVDDDGYDNKIASNKNTVSYYHNLKVKEPFTAEVYAYPDDTASVGSVRYAAGDAVRGSYLYYAEPLPEYRGGVEWYYIEKDGQHGWISPDWDHLEEIDWESSDARSELPSLYRYDTDTDPDIEETTVPANADPLTEPESVSPAETSAAPDGDSTTDTDAIAQFETTVENEILTVSGRQQSPAKIIGVCIVAALVLALTAFVTLQLIRRKKGQ